MRENNSGFFKHGWRYHPTPSCDANFNRLSDVIYQSRVAKYLLNNPSEKVYDVIYSVSVKCLNVLLTCCSDKKSFFEVLLEYDVVQRYTDKRLLSRLENVIDSGSKPTIENIVEILGTKVYKKNFMYHFRIQYWLADVLSHIHMKEKFSPLQRDVRIMDMFNYMKKNYGVNEDFSNTLRRLFPKDEDHRNTRMKSGNKPHSVYDGIVVLFRKNPKIQHGLNWGEDEEKHDSNGLKIKRSENTGKIAWNMTISEAVLKESSFINDCWNNRYALVSGASNSTARWLSMLTFMGLDEEDLWVYCTLIAAYFVYFGHHSWVEVMRVFENLPCEFVQQHMRREDISTCVHPLFLPSKSRRIPDDDIKEDSSFNLTRRHSIYLSNKSCHIPDDDIKEDSSFNLTRRHSI